MEIRKIRSVEGKETRVEYLMEVKGDTQPEERKMRTNKKPEVSFTEALQAFMPLLVEACDLGKAWTKSGVITGLTFGEEKAKGGGTRYNLMIHARHTPESSNAPILFNSPLYHESTEDSEIGKKGFVPEAWDAAIEAVRKQAVRFLQGKRHQEDLPFAKAS